MQGAAKEVAGSFFGSAKGKKTHGDGAAHDQGQGRIPQPRQVKKTDHLAGIGHAGNQQAPAEQQAHDEFAHTVCSGTGHDHAFQNR